LAVRLVWEAALLERLGPQLEQRWHARGPIGPLSPEQTRALRAAAQRHEAYERAVHRPLLAALPCPAAQSRPLGRFVQAVFCIDVRSEPVRRTLERLDEGIETRGCAGFFGAAVEWVPFAEQRGLPHCPALVEPSHVIVEALDEAGGEEQEGRARRARRGRALRKAAARVAGSFRSAVPAFAFVETAGLGYALRLIGDGLGLTRPAPDPATMGLTADTVRRLRP
ncbi:MAG: DUF2309 family protein, partial [Myxococcales bacterium]|nr:DUF2309 family protein [Myxococcales bacterium]